MLNDSLKPKQLTPKQRIDCICSYEIKLGFVQSRQLSSTHINSLCTNAAC